MQENITCQIDTIFGTGNGYFQFDGSRVSSVFI